MAYIKIVLPVSQRNTNTAMQHAAGHKHLNHSLIVTVSALSGAGTAPYKGNHYIRNIYRDKDTD